MKNWILFHNSDEFCFPVFISCFNLCIYLFLAYQTYHKPEFSFPSFINFLHFKACKLDVSLEEAITTWYIWGAHSILNRFEFFSISHENIQGELPCASTHFSSKQDIFISSYCFSLDMASRPLTNIWMHSTLGFLLFFFWSLLKYCTQI